MQIPKASCIYNTFDVDTLAPLNHETRARLLELRLDKLQIKGKSILDIGCNNGYLSFICSELGAKSITAIDVQEPLLEFVREIARKRYPTIDVKNVDYKVIDTSAFQADIVFFLEVLHWFVAQGLSVTRAIEKLASMTREVAILEFPWSVDEPSIKAQTSLTANEYSADLIFDQLSLNFSEVDVVNFNTYFRGQKGSKRVLVIAKQPKRTRFLQPWLPGIGRIESNLLGSENHILTCDHKNVYCVRTLKENASILEMPPTLLKRMFLSLEKLEGLRSAVPIEIDGSFVVENPLRNRIMVYPWIGLVPIGLEQKARNIGDGSHNIAVALKVMRAFRALTILPDEASRLSRVVSRLTTRITNAHDMATALLINMCNDHVPRLRGPSDEGRWVPVHGDIHFGNVVVESAGPILVDFENVSVNTEYFDLLWAIVMSGVTDPSVISSVFAQGERIAGRAVEFRDFVSVFASFHQWRQVIGALNSEGRHQRTIEKVEHSLNQLAAMIGSVMRESA